MDHLHDVSTDCMQTNMLPSSLIHTIELCQMSNASDHATANISILLPEKIYMDI